MLTTNQYRAKMNTSLTFYRPNPNSPNSKPVRRDPSSRYYQGRCSRYCGFPAVFLGIHAVPLPFSSVQYDSLCSPNSIS